MWKVFLFFCFFKGQTLTLVLVGRTAVIVENAKLWAESWDEIGKRVETLSGAGSTEGFFFFLQLFFPFLGFIFSR